MQKPIEAELPKNVTLRDFDDFSTLRGDIFNNVKTAMTKAFPLNYGAVRLELHDVDYDNIDDVPISEQKKHLLENKYITKKLRGTVKLFDNDTNQMLEEKRLSLMRVPYLTNRGTFIHGGNEYATIMQSRLLPGVYTRRQANGELETQFNVKPGTGVGFRVGFEPETTQYRLKISQANLHLYSLLKDLGTKDEELEKAWGPDIFNANKNKYDSRVFDKAYERLVSNKQKKLDVSREDKAKSISSALESARIHARVAQKNLPSMFNPKIATEWQARWEGKQAAEKVASAVEFKPDLTPEEILTDYGIKSAADMRHLSQARQHSANAKLEYKKKTAIMAAALANYPDEFIVDSPGRMSGITHVPTGFRIHVPSEIIPSKIKRVFEEHEETVDPTIDKIATALAEAGASVPAKKKYYHGSSVPTLSTIRDGSYITPDKSIAELMGRFHLDTGKTWTDDDLSEKHVFGQEPKWLKEPKGQAHIYETYLTDEEVDNLDNPYEHKTLKEVAVKQASDISQDIVNKGLSAKVLIKNNLAEELVARAKYMVLHSRTYSFLNSLLNGSAPKKASEDFSPDLEPDELTEAYNAIYGHHGSRHPL